MGPFCSANGCADIGFGNRPFAFTEFFSEVCIAGSADCYAHYDACFDAVLFFLFIKISRFVQNSCAKFLVSNVGKFKEQLAYFGSIDWIYYFTFEFVWFVVYLPAPNRGCGGKQQCV